MKSKPRGTMIEVKCEACQEPKQVRVSDVKRGWGRFCSKSCKAKKKAEGL